MHRHSAHSQHRSHPRHHHPHRLPHSGSSSSSKHRYAPVGSGGPGSAGAESGFAPATSLAAAAAASMSAESGGPHVAEEESDRLHGKAAAGGSKSLWSRLTAPFASSPSFRERTIYLAGGCNGDAAPSVSSGSSRASTVGASGQACAPSLRSFPANVVRNQKYHLATFLPHFLYEQFKFFFNFYFLAVALSQFIPVLQIGFLFTYVAPLTFVLLITLAKEAVDDLQRWRRDREANGQRYQRFKRTAATGSSGSRRSSSSRRGNLLGSSSSSSAASDSYAPECVLEDIPSSDIRVGDVLLLHTNQRVPADLLLLRTHDRSNGSIFIRTDQLDGETDWKLRNAVRATQALDSDEQVTLLRAQVNVEAPRKEIYEFAAAFTAYPTPLPNDRRSDLSAILSGEEPPAPLVLSPSGVPVVAAVSSGADSVAAAAASSASAASLASSSMMEPVTEGLTLEHTLWANTVVASGTVVALVLYTGAETRAAMNASTPTTKTGALDSELNRMSKMLFGLTVALAFVMTALKGLHGAWLIYLFRFVLLFSSIIPISMRVNLDLSKTLYARLIETDNNIPGTLVRNSSIPEELGRISYLFTDKTGTLTRNIMHFKCLQLEPPYFYTKHTLHRLKASLLASFVQERRARMQALGLEEPLSQQLPPVRDVNGAVALSPIALTTPVTDYPNAAAATFDSVLMEEHNDRQQRNSSRCHSPSGSGGMLLADVALDGGVAGSSGAVASRIRSGGAGSPPRGSSSPSVSSSGNVVLPPPGHTSKMQRLATRLQLEAEEAEEDESALALRVAGGDAAATAVAAAAAAAAAASIEEESESDLTTSEAGSFLVSTESAAAQKHRHALAAAALRGSGKSSTAPLTGRRKHGYNNLADSALRHDEAVELSALERRTASGRGSGGGRHHDGDEEDLLGEEDDLEMARLESTKAAAAALSSSHAAATAVAAAATNATARRTLGASPRPGLSPPGGAGSSGGDNGFDADSEGSGPGSSASPVSVGAGGSGAAGMGRSRSASPLDADDASSAGGGGGSSARVESMVRGLVTALALCHNVTPVVDEDTGATVYQASSPDEVALVKFTESVGLKLVERTQHLITLQTPLAVMDQGVMTSPNASPSTGSGANDVNGHRELYDVLHVFPFTSESKRMGIIVRARPHASASGGVVGGGEIVFYAKGAEAVMKSKILPSDWLEEEVDNLARVGLRTLVIACKRLNEGEYADFARRLHHAQSILTDRDAHVAAVLHGLEKNLTLLGLTGVEDKLQEAVKPTLETLRNAGIRVWMLTGDKAETATCIGISARLIDRNQSIFQFLNCTSQRETARMLDLFGSKVGTCLVIDGPSLQICLDSFQKLFLELACTSPAVICCRCSPTQKATVVSLMRAHTGLRTAAIGDGGNDCSMILAASVGVGIVGLEGMQASLAADFSITQFSFILPLLLWHGRNAYKRSARLSQFVIHRGLIISIIQAVFSALFFFAAVPVYNGWLVVGYATFYTMLPVFSLVLDVDVEESKVYLYPELYRELQKGRPLSSKTFVIWIFQSVYQGGIIMMGVLALFEARFLNIVSITFTALIASELLNVALEIVTWHRLMVVAEVCSVLVYFASLFFLPAYFDLSFIFTWPFVWKVALITTVSCLPPAVVKYLHSKYNPSAQSKINES